METGTAKNGKQWSIELRESCDKRHYSVVTVGAKKRVTDKTYRTPSAAHDGGIYLLDLMLAEAGTCRAD